LIQDIEFFIFLVKNILCIKLESPFSKQNIKFLDSKRNDVNWFTYIKNIHFSSYLISTRIWGSPKNFIESERIMNESKLNSVNVWMKLIWKIKNQNWWRLLTKF